MEKLKTPQFDLCIFKIGQGKVLTEEFRRNPLYGTGEFLQKFEFELTFEATAIDKEWKPKPIPLKPNNNHHKNLALGYDGSEMVMVKGVYHDVKISGDDIQYEDDGQTVHSGQLTMTPALERGMSGGPWLLGHEATPDSLAIGSLAGTLGKES